MAVLGKKQNPEGGLGPEFIKVIYDEHGNPIGVKPANVSVMDRPSVGVNGSPRPQMLSPALEQWLTVISKNILALKANVEKIENTQNVDLSPIVQQIGEQKMLYKLLADQVNTMNEIIDMVAKEFSQQKTFTREMANKIEELNITFANMKSIENELDSLRNEMMQRFSYVDDKLSAAHRQFAAGSERTEADMIALQDVVTVMNERIADMNEKINEMHASIATMGDMQNIKNELIEEIVNRVSRRIKSYVAKKIKTRVEVKIKVKKKLKKRKIVRKIRKIKRVRVKPRKINKNLLQKKLLKSEITSYGNALVVTEKRAQKYGRAVFDIAKQMNENVVMIMQDKLSEADGFEPITYDAIDNSEAVFIVTPRKMRKNFAVRNAALKRRVFLVDKKLKFSEVKY